jgi:hypothetical protein
VFRGRKEAGMGHGVKVLIVEGLMIYFGGGEGRRRN